VEPINAALAQGRSEITRLRWLLGGGRQVARTAGLPAEGSGRAGLGCLRLLRFSLFCFRVLVTSSVFTREMKASQQQRVWFV